MSSLELEIALVIPAPNEEKYNWKGLINEFLL